MLRFRNNRAQDIVLSLAQALLFIALCNQTIRAQHIRIFATAIGNDSAAAFMGGSTNGSGLYQSNDTGKTWKHLGWNNLKTYSMDMVRSSNGKILYVASGLGVLRSTNFGETWKQVTDWRISEVTDIAIDQKHPDTIYIATAHGPWRSKDGGRTWRQLIGGLTVPYCSRVLVDSVRSGHVLLASEEGIYKLMGDSEWISVPSVQRGMTNKSEHKAVKIRSIVQLDPKYWIATSENSRVLVSFDSAKSFGTSSFGVEGMWCADRIDGIYPNGIASWRVTVMGGPSGADVDRLDDDVERRGHSDSVKNIHACLAIIDTCATCLRDFVTMFGTLGQGVFVYSNREESRRFGGGHVSFAGRDMIGVQILPGLQIWTLKSYLVTP
jgi:hypothetical protein